MMQYPLILAQKLQYKFSVIYCIKKYVELVEYLTKKQKLVISQLILFGLVRSNLTTNTLLKCRDINMLRS
jgi:hypothetical protein